MGRGGGNESRPVLALFEKATRADVEVRHLLAEAHGALANENARLVSPWLPRMPALTCWRTQHQAAMDNVTHLEVETRVHGDFAYEDR